MKKVSIIICTYNGEKYLREQLDSIISQTYPIHEIVVKDDCSTDGTIDIVREYQNKFPAANIRLIINERHEGINHNFFSAMYATTGEYIAISDQDDIWEPDKIELQVEAIGDKLLCSSFSKPFSSDGSSVAFDSRIPNYSLIRAMYVGSLSGHTLLIKRELLDYTPSMEITYDVQLQMVASTRDSIAYIPKVLVHHRRYSTAATYHRPTNTSFSLNNVFGKVVETIRYYKDVKPFMQRRFSIIADFLESLEVEDKVKSDAIRMARLQSRNDFVSYCRLTWLCIKKRKYLFHVEDKNAVRAVLRAAYFPIFCSYYFRYASKNYHL